MKFDKSKVYTALNADEVKVGSNGFVAHSIAEIKDKLEHFDNYYIGEISEILPKSECSRFVERSNECCYPYFYLIKEPVAKNLRPYKSVDEMLTHFRKYIKPALQGDCMPGVWVIEKSSGFAICVTGFGETDYVIIDGDAMSMSILLENYLYLDGSPCGIKED